MKFKETELIIIEDCDSELLNTIQINPYTMLFSSGSILLHTDNDLPPILKNAMNILFKNYKGLILLRR